MRKRKLIAAAVGLAVLVAAGAFVLWPRTDRITRENFDRIKEGMSRAEVEAILGPPGDYRTGPVVYFTPTDRDVMDEPSVPFEDPDSALWLGDRAGGRVGFDEAGCVTIWDASLECRSGERVSQGPVDNLLWRAERLWRKWFSE
jgi:hypothetical protein